MQRHYVRGHGFGKHSERIRRVTVSVMQRCGFLHSVVPIGCGLVVFQGMQAAGVLFSLALYRVSHPGMEQTMGQ